MTVSEGEGRVLLAVGAHPDDIEFMMAGTLLRMKAVGYRVHMWSIASGSLGGNQCSRTELKKIRERETLESAAVAGALAHPPLVDDMEIMYEKGLLARVAAVIREVRPGVILVPWPRDYVEDHVNTCRLVLSAAFARGIRSYSTDPCVEHWEGKTVIYHAMPYGLTEGLGEVPEPGFFVDITGVIDVKKEMLSRHASQAEWLERSQGINPEDFMLRMCRKVGGMSGRFELAEGFTRHSHLGFCDEGDAPVEEALKRYICSGRP